jgi:hypothetical protein
MLPALIRSNQSLRADPANVISDADMSGDVGALAVLNKLSLPPGPSK